MFSWQLQIICQRFVSCQFFVVNKCLFRYIFFCSFLLHDPVFVVRIKRMHRLICNLSVLVATVRAGCLFFGWHKKEIYDEQ